MANNDVKDLLNYTQHDTVCIRSSWCAGRPTNSGGYETKFGNTWYESRPVDREPKCNCGLDDLIARVLNG